MKKALFGALLAIGAVITTLILIVKKGPIVGTMVFLVLAVLYLVVSVVSAIVNRHGKDVSAGDRHP